jgi:hypothetical protein
MWTLHGTAASPHRRRQHRGRPAHRAAWLEASLTAEALPLLGGVRRAAGGALLRPEHRTQRLW